ncbi:MAG TPA: PfkB family carbohydrate kinase [Actinomycetes bacterium]|nr:PfkB family carbohydrate kinase [Actinomycetes bacterium]
MADRHGKTAGPADGHVMIFAPLPILTVTAEDRGDGLDIHLHAGGQGVWQARMVAALDTSVTICALFGGETGQVLRHLIASEGIELRAVLGTARNGAYIHDRRSGRRVVWAEDPGDPALVMIDDACSLIEMPDLQPVDPRGAGDSMTAGIAAGLAAGREPEFAVRLGAAAGAVNVTRSGLGTGDGSAVIRLLPHIRLKPLPTGVEGVDGQRQRRVVSLGELAAEVTEQ